MRAGLRQRWFGPGLVSGASANDPTTVGSIAVVASATGYGMAWLVVLLLPMLAVVQAIAASVAAVSGLSLQQSIARRYGTLPAYLSLAAVAGIGFVTLVADVQAGAAALSLLTGFPAWYFVVPIVVLAGWLLAGNSYLRVERILAAVTLIFLCYPASAILSHPDWGAVARAVFLPHFAVSPAFVAGAVALLGTTLTGYVYFWESIEVAERRPRTSDVRGFRADAALGMLVTGLSFLFILVSSATTLGRTHLPVRTAAEAAVALRPLAGSADELLFGIALLASAAIAVPVIAATNGYVVAQTLKLPAGLALRIREAPAFYATVFGSLAAAAVLASLPIATMSLLYWASIAAGLATPVTLALTVLVARDRAATGERAIGGALEAAGWIVTGVVTAACAAFVLSAPFAR